MDFIIELYKGTNTIQFGMTSKEIQSILKTKPELFKQSEYDLFETEFYPKICKVYYEAGTDNSLICSAIEFMSPSKVYYEGIQLMDESRYKIEEMFNRKFNDCKCDYSGCSSDKYEISIYAPPLPNKRVQSVYITRKGYKKEYSDFLRKASEENSKINNFNMIKYQCLNCKTTVTSELKIAKCPKCDSIMIPKFFK